MAAGASFAGAIVFALLVFQGNSVYLKDVIKGEKPANTWLIWCDRFLFTLFLLGVVFTCSVGILSGYKRKGEPQMTQDKRMSLPDDDSTRSLVDIEDLRPEQGQGGGEKPSEPKEPSPSADTEENP